MRSKVLRLLIIGCICFGIQSTECTNQNEIDPKAIEPNDATEVQHHTDTDGAEPSKSKRGILPYGGHHHHGYHDNGFAHGLTYNIPLGTAAYPHYGFQKPWYHPATASKFPSSVLHHSNFGHHHYYSPAGSVPASGPPGYFITPGSASVTSYNVNYPKYPFYAAHGGVISKPANHHHHFDIARPAYIPTTIVKAPPPPLVPIYTNRIPIARPTAAGLPLVPSAPHYQIVSPAAAPVYPFEFPDYPHHHHHHISAPAAPVHPSFIPVPLPLQPTIHTFPTVASVAPTFPTFSTAATLPGTTFIATGDPASDAWRPIVVHSPTPTPLPTIPTSDAGTVHRPAISLLPPYGGNSDDQQTHQQIELQQQSFEEYASQHQQQPPQPQQLYLSPSAAAQIDQQNNEFIQSI